MKILIISPGYSPVTDLQGGAVEKLIELYLNHNEQIGDEIVLYTVKTDPDKYDKKIYNHTKYRIINKTGFKFKLMRAIYGIANKFINNIFPNAYIKNVVNDLKKHGDINEFDRIIFENGQNYIPFFIKKLKPKGKIILHLHNDYLNSDTKYGEIIYKKCDEIWAISKFIKNRVDYFNDSSESKVKVLYNTIDYSMYKKRITESEKNEIRKELNIKENDFVLIYVGRLMESKGVLELIKAFNIFNSKYLNSKLIIVGGNFDNKEKGDYITTLYKEKGDNENIIFKGYVPSNEVYKFYQLSNVQVIPTKANEAFGLVCLEGIASGLPIIATNSGAMPEILDKVGFFVERTDLVNNIEMMLEKILNEKHNFENYEIYYQNIMEKFSYEKYVQEYEKLLK